MIAAVAAVFGVCRGIVACRDILAEMEMCAIREVRVVPEDAAPVVLTCLPDLRGRSLLFLNLEELGKSVSAWNQVERYRLVRVFPSVLEIHVELRRPWMRVAGTDTYFDREGIVVPAPAHPEGFWSVSGIALSHPPDDGCRRSLSLLREVERWYNQYSISALFAPDTVDISDPRTVVLRRERQSVRLRAENIGAQCEQLADILRTCARDGKKWEYIDMRWHRPSGKLSDERGTSDGH